MSTDNYLCDLKEYTIKKKINTISQKIYVKKEKKITDRK